MGDRDTARDTIISLVVFFRFSFSSGVIGGLPPYTEEGFSFLTSPCFLSLCSLPFGGYNGVNLLIVGVIRGSFSPS